MKTLLGRFRSDPSYKLIPTTPRDLKWAFIYPILLGVLVGIALDTLLAPRYSVAFWARAWIRTGKAISSPLEAFVAQQLAFWTFHVIVTATFVLTWYLIFLRFNKLVALSLFFLQWLFYYEFRLFMMRLFFQRSQIVIDGRIADFVIYPGWDLAELALVTVFFAALFQRFSKDIDSILQGEEE